MVPIIPLILCDVLLGNPKYQAIRGIFKTVFLCLEFLLSSDGSLNNNNQIQELLL